MGRATITGGGTDGLYTVELDLGADRIAGIVSALESSKADREAELPDLQQAANDAEQEATEAVQAVDDAIDAIDPETFDLGAVREATAALAEAVKKRDAAKFKKVQVESQISSLTLEINRLNAVETSRTLSMWCADYTEDASGEVATIEVPGEAQKQVIVPGGEAWNTSAGQLIARAAQTANQVYFNAAVLPGMQRHIHPWRVGTITGLDVDNDTADVTLDTETSSAQSLQVGDPDALSGVPVNYMTCNASAFEDGDRVVVDMRGPTVVGFESAPRPCPDMRIFELQFASLPDGRDLWPSSLAGSTSCDSIGVEGRFGPWWWWQRYVFLAVVDNDWFGTEGIVDHEYFFAEVDPSATDYEGASFSTTSPSHTVPDSAPILDTQPGFEEPPGFLLGSFSASAEKIWSPNQPWRTGINSARILMDTSTAPTLVGEKEKVNGLLLYTTLRQGIDVPDAVSYCNSARPQDEPVPAAIGSSGQFSSLGNADFTPEDMPIITWQGNSYRVIGFTKVTELGALNFIRVVAMKE